MYIILWGSSDVFLHEIDEWRYLLVLSKDYNFFSEDSPLNILFLIFLFVEYNTIWYTNLLFFIVRFHTLTPFMKLDTAL